MIQSNGIQHIKEPPPRRYLDCMVEEAQARWQAHRRGWPATGSPSALQDEADVAAFLAIRDSLVPTDPAKLLTLASDPRIWAEAALEADSVGEAIQTAVERQIAAVTLFRTGAMAVAR